MKRVAVLGSTGSIGTQTLDVARAHPDLLRVVALAAGSDREKLAAQAAEFGAASTLFADDGVEGLERIVRRDDVDLVVVAVAGVIGLRPTLAAIEAGKAIALASKEVLVAAGELVMTAARAAGTVLTPVDSEHSALFQCLAGYRPDQIGRLVVTGSGGPFRGRKREDLVGVTVEQALNHPTYRMGGKITVDSATLMNKGLEVLEARWLFDVPLDRIEVVVHPQSVVHSLVEFTDGSVLGQLGWPDMRLPIQIALLWPERPASGLRRWNPVLTPSLTFEPPDPETFRCLALARAAGEAGGTVPAVLNAANEAAVGRFLAGEIAFLDIADLVAAATDAHRPEAATLENVLRADAEARGFVRRKETPQP